MVFVLASYIRTSGCLLEHLPNKASLLNLLSLSLKVLLLYFLPLLGLLKAFRLLSPIALTILRLGLLLPASAFVPSPPICLSSISLANNMLQWVVSQCFSVLCFGSFFSYTIIFTRHLRVSFPPLYRPRP